MLKKNQTRFKYILEKANIRYDFFIETHPPFKYCLLYFSLFNSHFVEREAEEPEVMNGDAIALAEDNAEPVQQEVPTQ